MMIMTNEDIATHCAESAVKPQSINQFRCQLKPCSVV